MTDRIYYDFHIHSCLSPCGDADMTPNNIVNMAKLKRLDVIALTDHNASGNCAATMKVGEREGLLVLPGMELCTSEDIHVVCLFSELDGALAFEEEVRAGMPKIKNKSEIFGEQLFLDDMDNIIKNEEILLLSAAGIGVDDAAGLCHKYGGTAFPAHADKMSNGIIAILGAIPPEAGFCCAELSPNCNRNEFIRANPSLNGLGILCDSDAHYLGDISEKENILPIDKLNRKSIVSILNKNISK